MKTIVHLTIEGTIETIEIEKGELSLIPLDYGKSLRDRRRKRELTLVQLNQLSGVSVSEISRIEKGKRKPNITIVARLEKALEIPE